MLYQRFDEDLYKRHPIQFGWGPLHFAVYYGHLNIVKQLVNVCKLPPEQKTKVQVAKDCCMSSTGCM